MTEQPIAITERVYWEREQAFQTGIVTGLEGALDRAYRLAQRTGNTGRVETLTAQLQAARIRHATATDQLRGL